MNTLDFSYQGLPWNIIFGSGTINRLPQELDALGLSRVIVLVTPNQVDDGHRVAKLLGDRCVAIFDQAKMHVPLATVELAIAKVNQSNADCTVSLGGGSTTGLGKALALKLNLPNIVIPTSYAGSEMTNIWGITENQRKVTGRDNNVLPTLTIYDPDLTLTLPPTFAATSGLNAMAQAVVNVTAAEFNPMISAMGLEAVKALSTSLPMILNDPNDMSARSQALYGACMAGASLGTGTTGLHHRLCHTFGGTFNTPHAETHTILLPYSVAFNATAVPVGTKQLADALGAKNAAKGLLALAKRLNAPTSLQDIGIKFNDLALAAGVSTETPINNPRPIDRDQVYALLEQAYYGRLD